MLDYPSNLHWELKYVPHDGTPFLVVGRKTYACHQGEDKHASEKKREAEMVNWLMFIKVHNKGDYD